MRVKHLIAVATLAGLAGLSLFPDIGAGQERDLKFTLDFIPLGRHAPWYVAVAKGYYKQEGLNVTIASARAQPIRSEASIAAWWISASSTFRASWRPEPTPRPSVWWR